MKRVIQRTKITKESEFFLVLISSIGHKLVLRTCNAAANLVDVGPDEEGAISDQGATDIQLWFRN